MKSASRRQASHDLRHLEFPNTAEILFLIAAIIAGLYAAVLVIARDPIGAFAPAAICLVALGLLAL